MNLNGIKSISPHDFSKFVCLFGGNTTSQQQQSYNISNTQNTTTNQQVTGGNAPVITNPAGQVSITDAGAISGSLALAGQALRSSASLSSDALSLKGDISAPEASTEKNVIKIAVIIGLVVIVYFIFKSRG